MVAGEGKGRRRVQVQYVVMGEGGGWEKSEKGTVMERSDQEIAEER